MCEEMEIEITEEMIEAGAMAVDGLDAPYMTPHEIAEATFRAMLGILNDRRIILSRETDAN